MGRNAQRRRERGDPARRVQRLARRLAVDELPDGTVTIAYRPDSAADRRWLDELLGAAEAAGAVVELQPEDED